MIKVENYPNAYKEVYVILKNMNINDVRKIPESFIDIIKTNMNKDYKFKLDKSKKFQEQKILRETKVILAYISLNYWANSEQKFKIQQKFKKDIMAEEIKKPKYIPEELFKNRQLKKEEKVITESKNEIIKYRKANLFSGILKKITSVFIKK